MSEDELLEQAVGIIRAKIDDLRNHSADLKAYMQQCMQLEAEDAEKVVYWQQKIARLNGQIEQLPI